MKGVLNYGLVFGVCVDDQCLIVWCLLFFGGLIL